MSSQELCRLFAAYAEESDFRHWSKKQKPIKTVYAGEYGMVWKFTLKEWWQTVKAVIRNEGVHEFPVAGAMARRPKHLTFDSDGMLKCPDTMIHCVNPRDWTLPDWMHELECFAPAAEPAERPRETRAWASAAGGGARHSQR